MLPQKRVLALRIPSGKGHQEGHRQGHPKVSIIGWVLTDDLPEGHLKGHLQGHPKVIRSRSSQGHHKVIPRSSQGHPKVIPHTHPSHSSRLPELVVPRVLNGHPHTSILIIIGGGLTEYARSKLYRLKIRVQFSSNFESTCLCKYSGDEFGSLFSKSWVPEILS